jgi:hypothetical protein
VGCFFLDEVENVDFFLLEEGQGWPEVEIGKVRDHLTKLFIFTQEIFHRNELVVLHSGAPDSADRHHQDVFTPFALHLDIDLSKLFVT